MKTMIQIRARYLMHRHSTLSGPGGESGKLRRFVLRVLAFALALLSGSIHAQWVTQSVQIKPGWSAVYLHVDASYTSLDSLMGFDPNNPITQVWLWQAAPSVQQYVTTPSSPLTAGSQWIAWYRPSLGQSSSLGTLIQNAAYLVYSSATTNYTWQVKGRPAPPAYVWDISGLNLIGFPTPHASAPRFDAFLSPDNLSGSVVDLFQYTGGDLSASNPLQVLSTHATRVNRGQAFWMRISGGPPQVVNNTYFGPFQLSLPAPSGFDFGDSVGQSAFRLRNASTNTLTVSANLLASEAPPDGQPAILGLPPVLVRQSYDVTNAVYGAAALGPGAYIWTLPPAGQPGSDIEVILGINRYAMTNTPGLYAGVLRFSDSLGLTEVDVPISAQTGSTAGLWVGSASVTRVANYLTSYQANPDGTLAMTNGSYIAVATNTDLTDVPAPFPLRLIIHNDGTQSYLLQRVYFGYRSDSSPVVATTQDVLDPAQLSTARRITANHLPWTPTNTAWALSGQLALGGSLSSITPVAVDYGDQAANPFLHTYHPDHDNLDATFKTQLPRGAESYGITRQVNLLIAQPGNDFGSLTKATASLSGVYSESMTLLGTGTASRTFLASGSFVLNRISGIPVLTRQ